MGAKLFVANVNPLTTKSQLAQFFSPAGRVETINIPVERDTSQPRGFCFVEFADRDAAEQAFLICDGRQLDGRELRLSWARDKDEGGADRLAQRQRGPQDSFTGDGPGKPEELAGGREPSWFEEYTKQRRFKRRRHGKHGSDRKHRHGTRRVIE